MTFLTRLSLANRMIVGLMALAVVGLGLWATLTQRQELLPSTQVPTAIVTATYQGATPQIVSEEVAEPIETALTAVNGVTRVTSTSYNNLASLTVEWEYGLDSARMADELRAAIDGVRSNLPEDVDSSVLTGSTDDIPVLLLAVASDAPLAEAGSRVRTTAVPELSSVDGVRQVTLTGEAVQEVEVLLRPADLRRHDLTAQQVIQTLQANNVVVPAGSSFAGTSELAVEVGTAPGSLKALRAIRIPSTDRPVRLSAVADVELEAVRSTTQARATGRPALSIAVTKDRDADAVRISHVIAEKLPDLERRLGDNTTFTTVFDQAPLIEQSIHDLAVEGALGLAFAVIIIMVFLWSVRSTIITALSIPMSVLIAMLALKLGDYSLNIFTLAAMTVAVGRVVDDSIVVIENIKRRTLGHASIEPVDVIAAVKEVAGAVTASTLTTVVVFLPVAFVSGVVGELFRPFAVTVAVALAASLLVSLTVVPVLAYWFLQKRGTADAHAVVSAEGALQHTAEEMRVTRLQRTYLPVLRWGLRHPVVTLAAAVLVFVGTMGSATLLKTDFIGSVADDATLQIRQELQPGTRLSVTDEAVARVEAVLARTPEVTGYLTTVGGAGVEQGFASVGQTHIASITVQTAPGGATEALRQRLQEQVDSLRDAGEITVTTQDSGAASTDITVLVSGEDEADLRRGAEHIEQVLGEIDGLSDVRSNLAERRQVLEVDVDRARAAAQGFTPAEVGQAISGALTGTRIGTVTLSGKTRDLVVRTQATDASPEDIANLRLPVSQIQQAKAQEKAADRLAAKQERTADEQQGEAEEALREQRQELREQRGDALDALAGTRATLRRLRANPPQPPTGVPPVPVTADQLARQQYAQQMAQYQQQVAQLSSAVDQAEQGIEQIDKQLDALAEQEDKTAEQRRRSEELSEEQEDLADVRATPIRVKDIAKVSTVEAPTTVTSVDGTPSVTVTATPTASDLGALSQQIQQRLADDSERPAGVTATLGGAVQEQQKAFEQLGLAMVLAIVMVFVIMVATFRSLLQPLILLVSIPFAATGAVLALLLTDTPLGVPAMVGLLMLIGIVVTNAIVLIDLINQYRARGSGLSEAILDGSRLRLRPIIMTACATIFALIPMALGLTGGGAFISRPLAIVVIGGLVSSTVLTLLLVPVLYSLAERRGDRRRAVVAA
jgi:multidrug efflux pump subunit AcrB